MSASSFGGERCPHCGGITRAEAHDELRWVCGACGGPVIPGVSIEAIGDDGRASLVKALRETRAALAGSLSAVVAGLVAMGLALIALVALSFAWRVVGVVTGAGAILAIVQSFVLRRVRASREKEAARALDDAWKRAAAALARANGGAITPRELATATRVSDEVAERALATLSADGDAHADVGDDAEIRYRLERR